MSSTTRGTQQRVRSDDRRTVPSRRPARSFAVAVFAIATTITLAACAGADGDGGGGGLTYEDSPLSKYLEAVNGVWDEERAAKEQQEVEELVATCMTEEGFEYTPVDHSQFISINEDMEERGTEEWVAANGWGMVQTQEDMDEQQAQAEEFVDPNQPYVESLSPTEQEAYFATLYGTPPTEEEMGEDGSYEYNWETAGCQGAAQHELQGDSYWEDERFAGLVEDMNALWEDLPKRPEIVELNQKWSDCMADAEYPGLELRQDAQMQISEEMNAFWEGQENPEPPSEEQLAELKEKEIAMAIADFHCAKELDYDTTQFTAQFALEQQFIDDHKAELDELVAAYAKGE
jgi:hypothetical protein